MTPEIFCKRLAQLIDEIADRPWGDGGRHLGTWRIDISKAKRGWLKIDLEALGFRRDTPGERKAATRFLDKLEQDGLVERGHPGGWQRRGHIRLTPAGQQMAGQLQEQES